MVTVEAAESGLYSGQNLASYSVRRFSLSDSATSAI